MKELSVAARDLLANTSCTAFQEDGIIAQGPLREVVAKLKAVVDREGPGGILIFEDASARIVDVDFQGPESDVLMQFAVPDLPPLKPRDNKPPGRGRPKLGVTAREITLLPRHWDWLATQPGGASVAIRRLVDETRKANAEKDKIRAAQESCYRFMSAMAGDRPGFEEATRALYASDWARFEFLVQPWPIDVREHAKHLGADAFTD